MFSKMNLKLIASPARQPVYAVIQWRYANIRIRDGFLNTGTANPSSPVTAPGSAPTVAETTAASNLAIGSYYLKFTWVLNGETTPSPEASFTTTSGQLATVTLPMSPAGVTLANIYLTPLNGLSGSETLYLQNVTVSSGSTTAVALLEAYVVSSTLPPDINTTASYAVGVATMAVAGLGVILQTGIQFTIGGESTLPAPVYTIASHTETSGVTTSITFTPPLQQIVYYGATITFGPHVITVKVGEGNLTFSEKRPIMYVKDRGRLDTVKYGDDEPVDVKLETQWQFITAVSGMPPTIEDALTQSGQASSWISSASDPCEPYAVDLEIEYVPPCSGVQREIISFTTFRYEDLGHDIKAATISVTGKANITRPTLQRVA